MTIDPQIAHALHRSGIIDAAQTERLLAEIDAVNDPKVKTDELPAAEREVEAHRERT
jgi:hypothetical protein